MREYCGKCGCRLWRFNTRYVSFSRQSTHTLLDHKPNTTLSVLSAVLCAANTTNYVLFMTTLVVF